MEKILSTSPDAGVKPGPITLDRSASDPLWAQLRDDIAHRIEDGEFHLDFPGEHALSQQYGVSRQTVRMALRSLRESGTVSASRGQAPRVLRPQIEQPLGALYSLFHSVEDAGMKQVSIVLSLDERRDTYAAAKLGLDQEAPLVFLHRIRLADDEPLALDRVWMPASLARKLLNADFRHTALYTELAERCGVRPKDGSEDVDAITLLPPQAKTLGTYTGAPAFLIQRLSNMDTRPVEWRTTIVRADLFRISTSFSTATGLRMTMPGRIRTSF